MTYEAEGLVCGLSLRMFGPDVPTFVRANCRPRAQEDATTTPDGRAPFGTIKHWMGSTHFLTKTPARVSTESPHVLAYNLKRVMSVLGIAEMRKAMQLAKA